MLLFFCKGVLSLGILLLEFVLLIAVYRTKKSKPRIFSLFGKLVISWLEHSCKQRAVIIFYFCLWSLLSFFQSALCSLPYVIQAHKTVKYPTSWIGKHLHRSLKCRIYRNLSALIGFSSKYDSFYFFVLSFIPIATALVSWLLLCLGQKHGWSLMICYCSLSIKPFCCYMCDR